MSTHPNALAAVFLSCCALGALGAQGASSEVPLKPSGANAIGMEMVLAPPPGAGRAAPFYISRGAVTREQWRSVMPETTGAPGGGAPKRARRRAAEAFCRTLGALDGREYRLPTGEELDLAGGSAARGGELGRGAGWSRLPFRVVCPVSRDPDSGACAHVFFDEAPRLAQRPESANYPAMASWIHQEGDVLLRVALGADGRPRAVKAVRGAPAFRAAAAECVGQCRFEPATVDGLPVAASVVVEVPFRLTKWLYGAQFADDNFSSSLHRSTAPNVPFRLDHGYGLDWGLRQRILIPVAPSR